MDTVKQSVRASRDRARVAVNAAFGPDAHGHPRDIEEAAADLITDLLHALQSEFDLGTMVQVNGVPLDEVSGEEAVLGVLSEVVGHWLCVSRTRASDPDRAAQDLEALCGDPGEVTISGPGVAFRTSDPRWSSPYGRGWTEVPPRE